MASAISSGSKGIRCRIGTVPTQKAAATADIMAAILMRTPSTLTGKCNWARLAFGFARAFSRSKLVALDVAALREDSPGRR